MRTNTLPQPIDLVTVTIPRSALTFSAPLPELVSQRTAAAVLGLAPRQFLEALPVYRASGGIVSSLGKSRLVARAHFVAWLMSRGGSALPSALPSAEPPSAVDELAAELGLVAGGRR